MKSKNEASKAYRIMAAAVDMGLSSVISLAILQILRVIGLNSSLLWFFVTYIIIFELRDVIGKRSIGKRIFGLCIVNSSDENSTVTALNLLLRNIIDFIFPVVIFQICKYNVKNGDKIARTKVCTVQNENSKNDNRFIPGDWMLPIIIIATVALFYASCMWAGFSYIKNTDAYSTAVEYMRSSGYCKEIAECELKAGIVIAGKAEFIITVDDRNYVISLDYIDEAWTVIYCEYRDTGYIGSLGNIWIYQSLMNTPNKY